MGCGSSSLKGDEVNGAAAPVPVSVTGNTLVAAANSTPLKKVQTNFSTVNYEGPSSRGKSKSRGDKAPHELDDPKRSLSLAYKSEKNMDIDHVHSQEHEAKLKPYHTTGDEQEQITQSNPHENISPSHEGSHSHSQTAENGLPGEQDVPRFVSSPDDLNPASSAEQPRKKSLFAKIKDEYGGAKSNGARTGANRGQKFSEDELLKYTGVSRAEMDKRAKEGPKAPDQLQAYANAGIGGASV